MIKQIIKHFKSGEYRYVVRNNWYIYVGLGVYFLLDSVKMYHDGQMSLVYFIITLEFLVTYMTLPWTLGKKRPKKD